MLKKIINLFLVLLFASTLFQCKKSEKAAIGVLKLYIHAYSKGNTKLLKKVLSKNLLKKYEKFIIFFNKNEFKRIKKELRKYKIIVTKTIKTKKGIRINYYLYFSKKSYMPDSILIVKEGENWKIAETGMFVYK